MHDDKSTQKRVEDYRFLIGKGEFVDDLKSKKTAYLGFVRSPYAHAKILSIDVSEAKKNPDYIDYLTGEDIKETTSPIFANPGARETGRKQLAIGVTRFVGEPVVAFLSKTLYSVEDIAEAIGVEYSPLPVVMTVEDSMKADTKLYEGWSDNVSFRNGARKGNVDQGVSKNVIKARIGIKRQAGAPIEPRSYVAEYDNESGIFNVKGTMQSAHRLRGYLSAELKIDPSKIHAVVKDVGGGFGTKGAQSYPEPLLACIFAKRTGYVVKATTTRTEDLLETAAGRDQYCDIELSCDDNAKLASLKATLYADVGVSGTLSTSTRNTVGLLPEVYKIPNFDIAAACYLTDKAPLGPVRGAGRPEAAFFMERAIDLLAHRIRIDPLEFRRRNLIEKTDLPFDNGAGATYDSGDYALLLQKLDPYYKEMMRWRDETNKNPSITAGVGVCIAVEDTGAMMKESAKVTMESDGNVLVVTGTSPHGQGLETSLAQVCAEELHVPMESVKVTYGDTNLIAFGIGTFGSRSMCTGGSAVIDASRKIKQEIIKRIATLTGAPEQNITIENGEIIEISGGGAQVTAKVLMSLSSLVQKTGVIEAYSEYSLKGMPYASSAHACALTIDKDTGKVRIHRYVAVDDCGTVVNKMIVDGQLHGGIVHGVGGSLLEEIVYNDEGQILTSNFLDYTIPSALDIPDAIELAHIETPSPNTLNGAKGVGESGTIAAYPCVLNAINDALLKSGSTGELNYAPATPEKVRKLIKR
ncbi:MAG: xanthine dehydrogenase family protein molybdopterin-binding subunit [Nitrososphaerales archaeon]